MMNPEDATRFNGPGQPDADEVLPDADEVLRREVNWDVWAFWSIVIGVWGVVLGYVIAWLWEKIVG
jgi:hypothetical protein